MPVAVKERLLDLIDKNHQNYCDLVTYFMNSEVTKHDKERKAASFLRKEIHTLNLDNLDFPSELNKISAWLCNDNKFQCAEYQLYKDRRNSGGEREYFKNVSQAFEFLIKVAPVKRVDGSWLYSLVYYWNDPVFRELIQIYVEELGLGLATSNHVSLFDDLLVKLGLEHFVLELEDEYYHQPAIQLALAYAPPEFIPEIVGFNLGYEQLPLHLLITNYELNELGINPHYFNLHITIDNMDNGHAHLSIKALEKIYKKFKDKKSFMEKMKIGFALNNKGLSSRQIIQNLSSEALVLKILKRKALVGNVIHNDKCKLNNRSINEWLSEPSLVEEFIELMIEKQWIILNQDPEASRFWKLISHEEGKMYGVFNATEKQIIHDWIAGDYFKQSYSKYKKVNSSSNSIDEFMFSYLADGELENIQQQMSESGNLAVKINKLLPYLAPHAHHKETGLWCTQRFVDYLFPFLGDKKTSTH